MAWEWVAPIGTAAVGIAGIAATYFTGERGRRHARELADSKNAHDLLLAREQRQQQRQAEAYIEILTLANAVNQYLMLTDKKTGARPRDHAVPGLNAHSRIRALLAAYGSSEAQKLFSDWLDAVGDANESAKRLKSHSAASRLEQIGAAKEEFGSLVAREAGLMLKLGDRIATELQHGAA